MRRISACAVLLATIVASHPSSHLASHRAGAEMIVLQGGKTVAGSIVAEDAAHVRLKTGGPAGVAEISYSRQEIQSLYRGVDESKQIEQCGNSADLSRWAEEYFYAGLEGPAANCVNRAVAVSPAMGEKPRPAIVPADKTPDRFSFFWNRTLVRASASALTKRDAEGHLRLATWAKEGGLKDEAAFHLRRAWSVRPDLADARSLAKKWGIRLESSFRIDLRPALDQALFADTVQDEGQSIPAGPGKQFFSLPIRYESAAGPCTLSRASLRGKDVRGLYGLRSLSTVKGILQIWGLVEDAVYERMDVSLVETRSIDGRSATRLDLVGKNTSPPRNRDAPKSASVRNRPKSETLSATSWAAVIIEIPKDLDQLSFDWSDGREEQLDLSFLRRAADLSAVQPSSEIVTSQPEPEGKPAAHREITIPIVDHALRLVRARRGSMTALGIVGLGRARGILFRGSVPGAASEGLTSWCETVDAAIVSAAAKGDGRVRQAAWNYFMERIATEGAIDFPPKTLELVTALSPEDQMAWIDLISCATGVGSCSPWWSRIDARAANTDGEEKGRIAVVTAASRLLGAIMQARSREVCGKALDVFLRLDPAAVDWEILVDASPEAQIEALIRVDTLNDRVLARHVLRKLIARLQPKAAKRMAEQAQSLGVRLGIDDRSIFEQWHALESNSDRTSLLTALSGFDLGDLVYTHDFRVVMDDAASEGEDSSVREAALRLIMRQVALECGRSPSCARSASFPVLVSRSRQNAMLKGLSLAAAFGAADVRREAFKLMVRKGFAEEGSRAFAALAESADQSKELEALTGLPEISRCDSTIALLGRLLTPDHQELARRIVDHLSLVASQTPPDQRWRLFAALKAGADIPAMDELASQLSPPASDAVLVWLHSICHMSSQDRQRLASMAMPEDRLERLTEINLRRGRLIDGEYAALAIIETTLPRERAQSVTSFAGEKVRWQAPVHQTVLMPRLTLKAIDQTEAATGDELREDEYRAFWKDKSIGRGYIVAASQTIRRPDSYCPSLICGTDAWFEPGSTAGETQSDESRVAVGPLELPSRRPANAPASGTMTLDVSDWLRAGLSEAGAFAPSKANRLVPKPLEITLRYGAFGSYYGTTMRIKPPEERPPEGLPHLTNVMIVLERIDLPPENASASRP